MDTAGEDLKKIVLLGNPNVGKSALFSRLTGVRVVVSNYPGTTVEFLEGFMLTNEERVRVVDVPGIYSLESSQPAEQVAVKMAQGASAVINVLDATNLERSLYLTMELLETGHPLIVALNIFDDINHRGISLDVTGLEKLLGVPVVATSGLTGLGVKNLRERLAEARPGNLPIRTHEERWKEIGRIVEAVQKLTHRHHTLLEYLEDASVHHGWGMVIAASVLGVSFFGVRSVAEFLTSRVFAPLFTRGYAPLVERVSAMLGGEGFWHNLFVGTRIDGAIDFERSLGVLTTAPYVEFVMVLPYVAAFYLLLSFLEDVGYIPRLALLLDNVMHKLGLHGFAIIPMLLGFGCNVPGILATRILESTRERFIAALIISIGVPCAALQAMIVAMLGKFGGRYILLLYAILFVVWLLLGMIMNRFLKGYSPELLVEIPPYRLPSLRMFSQKVGMRIRGFIIEALPIVFLSVLVINLLQQARLVDAVSRVFAPIVSTLFGLPPEAAWALIIGLVRKDIAAGMLLPLDLTVKQLIIAAAVLSMSFPCLATFAVFFKELGGRRLALATLLMLASALLVGGTLNLVLP